MTAIVATGLGKRYRKTWALRDCTLEVPEGRVAALVGPNGAGKTTLLHLATGLLDPTTGTVSVLGRRPAQDKSLLSDVGFVAQDAPLYRNFTVADMLEFGRRMNERWDGRLALDRVERLGIPSRERVGHTILTASASSPRTSRRGLTRRQPVGCGNGTPLECQDGDATFHR